MPPRETLMSIVCDESRASSGSERRLTVVGSRGRERKRRVDWDNRVWKGRRGGLLVAFEGVEGFGRAVSLRSETKTCMPKALQRRAMCLPVCLYTGESMGTRSIVGG